MARIDTATKKALTEKLELKGHTIQELFEKAIQVYLGRK